MRPYTWVSVSLRLLGVFFLGISLPGVVGTIQMLYPAFATGQTQGSGSMGVWEWIMMLSWTIGPLLQLLLALYLLLFGKRLAAFCLKGVEVMCPRCAYSLPREPVAMCPECGLMFCPSPQARDGNPDRAAS